MADIKQSNPNAFAELDRRLKELEGKIGKVGWFESARYEDGTPVASVAATQEMGDPHQKIPPRPFMRTTLAEEQKKYSQMAAEGAIKILEGKATIDAVMGKIVLQAQNDISKKIASITSPPLSPVTIGARKYRKEGREVTGKTIKEIAGRLKAGTLDISGVSTKPLEDTGLMSSTLTSVVEDAS